MGLLIPCMLLLLLSGVASTTQLINGTIRGSVYFYESVPNNLSLQWSFGSTQIASRVPTFPPGCFPQYAGRCQMFNNGTLKLDNLTSADDGEYTFTAVEPPSTPVKTSIYNLRVYSILSTPVLSFNVSADRVISGTNVSLHCDAGSQTVTTYIFYHDGKNICAERHVTCRDSDLYFQPITESDNGRYTCTIQNPISANTSSTLQLSVSVPVSDVKLTSNISGLVWPGLDSVSLNCSARGTDVIYSWSLQGALLPQDPQYNFTENNRVLTIGPVSDKDNGTFTCTVANWINNETSNGITLNLGFPVTAVTLTSNASGSYIWDGEDSVTFNCSSDGSNVTFSWKLNGESLPQDPRYRISKGDSPPHSNLLINPVSRNDAGPFTCEASNRLGNKNSNALNLSLAWTPENRISCTAVSVGEHVELGCSWPGGQPAANVYLTFSGATENGTNSVNKLVSRGNASSGSSLTCNGYQLERTSNCSVTFESPEAPGQNNTMKKAKVGETVVLTINLKPGLPANFTWYRLNPDRVPIQTNRKVTVENTSSNSSLMIPDVTVKDAGQYECTATNFIGTQSFFFTVTVAQSGLSGGAIAGIVIGVLAGVALIGSVVFFIVKKKKRSGDNKRINDPQDQLGTSQYATVQKHRQNGGVAETSLTTNQPDDKDDVKYAEIKFPNNASTKPNASPPVETEYSTVKTSTKR